MSDELNVRLQRLEHDNQHLMARLAELERVRTLGDAERQLTIDEVAQRIRKSPATLRKWLKTPSKAERLNLALLMTKDACGDWYSTPRRLQQWLNYWAAKAWPNPKQAVESAARRAPVPNLSRGASVARRSPGPLSSHDPAR